MKNRKEKAQSCSSFIRSGGLLITDKRYVKVARKVDARQVELNLYQTVLERVGAPVVFNISVLGALIGMRPMVRKESVLQVLAERFPPSLPRAIRRRWSVGYNGLCLPGLNERMDARNYGKNTR